MPKYEYRIQYAASSNISFHNQHDYDWVEMDGEFDSVEGAQGSFSDDEIEREALELSGFEYWVEVREIYE